MRDGLLILAMATALTGCVQPHAIPVSASVPVASPSAGGDQAAQGGVVAKPAFAPAASQANEQTATAGPVSIPGSGNRVLVAPVTVAGSDWAIAAVMAVLAAAMLWQRRAAAADRRAAEEVLRSIRDLGPGRQRDRLLAGIELRTEAAGVRDRLDRMARRARASVKRSGQ